MDLSKDITAKRPGEWTQADIDSLKRKYNRTHFSHFKGAGVKLRSTKPPTHEWIEVSAGRWVRKKIQRKK